MSTTVAWFHCFNGVAGDMLLGSLLDAGADVDAVRSTVELLGIEGWSLEAERVQRCGIRATRAVVRTEETHHHRRLRDIRQMVDLAGLPPRVAARANWVFHRLARAEGAVHGVAPADVEFHEVGSLDAIVDVVGTCAAIEVLGIDKVWASPIANGLGTVTGSHGVLPNPPPAVLALLADAAAPARGVDVAAELATPTGVALVTSLAEGFGPMLPMTPERIGYGAGGRDLPGRPNVVQVVVGTAAEAGVATPPGQPVRLLEANVDDATGETIAHTIGALLAAGAHDAWVTPIVMKKGRPASTVHVLCDPARTAEIAAVLVSETGTLGLRGTTLERWPQQRDEHTVVVDGQAVRVKVGAGRVKAEHDDAAAAATALGVPLREVVRRAEEAGRRLGGS